VRREGRTAKLAAGALAAALLGSPPVLADDSAPAKAVACLACHGPDGNSANPAIPSLAAQPQPFIVMQLFEFREGNRKDAQMTPIAADLSNADLNELAAYFSGRAAVASSAPVDAAAAAAARQLIEQRGCNSCHGPALAGQQQLPRLAGQQRDYLATQLRGFKAGTRADADGYMSSAAQPLSDADIDLLAAYLSGLAPP